MNDIALILAWYYLWYLSHISLDNLCHSEIHRKLGILEFPDLTVLDGIESRHALYIPVTRDQWHTSLGAVVMGKYNIWALAQTVGNVCM